MANMSDRIKRCFACRPFSRGGLFFVAIVLLAGCGGSTASHGSPTATPVTIFSGSPAPTATNTPAGSGGGSGGPAPATPAPAGDVWAQLAAKPLKIPSIAAGAACPTTPSKTVDNQPAYGSGPAYITVGITNGKLQYSDASAQDAGSPWNIAQVHWQVATSYTGPVLVRGKQLDGTHALGFNGGYAFQPSNPEGTEPVESELRLMTQPPGGGQPYMAVSYVRVLAPGCYAVQFDGTSFGGEVVVFSAAK
jgi:hypothetical protein